MTSNARTSRRRRLLQEGTTSGAQVESDKSDRGSATRYAPKAGSASFAFASRILPHSWAAILATFCVLALILGGLACLEVFVKPNQSSPDGLLNLQGTASLAAWWRTALWLSAAAMAATVFGLRRARMDDLRCGYRWWAVGVFACVAMSAVAATNAHAWFAFYLAQASGFSPLPANSFWWLMPGVAIMGALAIRLIVDASESKAAIFLGCLAIGATAIGWVSDAELVPSAIRGVSPWFGVAVLGPLASMSGVSLALCAMLCLARRIVRESHGMVAPSTPRSERKSEKKQAKAGAKPREAAAKKRAPATPVTADEPAVVDKPASRRPAKTEEPTAWVGGGDDYTEEYDDQPQRRRLSKAERKRLRKQKARRAA